MDNTPEQAGGSREGERGERRADPAMVAEIVQTVMTEMQRRQGVSSNQPVSPANDRQNVPALEVAQVNESVRFRAKEPPLYSGPPQDVIEWIAAYEDVADFNQWSEEFRAKHVKISLTGVAIEWFRSHPQPPNWQDLKKSLD